MPRLAFLLAILSFAYIKAQEDCICEDYTEKEKQQIWDYLTKISGEMLDEEGVLPAVLSPLTPCGNCIDNVRRKRTVLPTVPTSDSGDYSDSEELSLKRNDPRCPVGYARVAFRCISLEELYK